jgi:DNA-binding helix-hairpin-helix protein with protein kinase domain
MRRRRVLWEQAMERAGFQCEFPDCNQSVLQMAHLLGSQMGGSKYRDHIDNVAMLCVEHHDWLDGRLHHGRRGANEQVLRAALHRTWLERQ